MSKRTPTLLLEDILDAANKMNFTHNMAQSIGTGSGDFGIGSFTNTLVSTFKTSGGLKRNRFLN